VPSLVAGSSGTFSAASERTGSAGDESLKKNPVRNELHVVLGPIETRVEFVFVRTSIERPESRKTIAGAHGCKDRPILSQSR
jgi:hypothetical protein